MNVYLDNLITFAADEHGDFSLQSMALQIFVTENDRVCPVNIGRMAILRN